MKRSLILLSLVILVFLAGCIGQPPEEVIPGVATGVVIKTFIPDIPEIFSGDSVTFYLSLENIGEEDATSVSAKLFGLGTDWSWNANKQDLPDLSKSQPDYEIPGGIADYTWDATSPSNLKVDNEYSAGVRVYYSYKTTALGNIKVYSEDYLRTLPFEEAQNIRKSSGLDSFSVTDAPVKIELAGLIRPIIYRGGNQSASVMVQMGNIGQGSPYDTAEDDMEITIEYIKVANATCVSKTVDVRIPRDKKAKKSVTCTFYVPPSGVTITEYTTIPIEVNLTYNYFVDGKTFIKVLQAI